MAQSPDVLVIGGGVIGLTTAYFLAREGAAVEVVDQGDFGQEASWAGAGIIPPGNALHARTPLDTLRSQSASVFPELSRELRERTDIDNGYLRSGGIELVAETDVGTGEEWGGKEAQAQELSQEQLHRLEPALSAGLERAYVLPAMAQLRNPRHLKALLAGCARQGVRLRPGCAVQRFERQGEQVTVVQTAHGPICASRYLVATGAWTDPLLEQLGWRPGIRPIRGQLALLNSGAPLFTHILLEGARYIVPRPDGRMLVGSTEEDVGYDKRTTAAAIHDLLAFAVRLVPGLAVAQVERCWAGLRPGSPDGLPFLGPVPGLRNVYVAAGHFRAGIQLSPATGLVMKELLLGQTPTIPLEAFRLDRPSAPPPGPAFRS